MLRIQIRRSRHFLVGVGGKVQQLHRLHHFGIRVLVGPAGVDRVPAGLPSGPDVDASVLVLAVGELSDVSDFDGSVSMIRRLQEQMTRLGGQRFQFPRQCEGSVGTGVQQIAWFGRGLLGVEDEGIFQDEYRPVVGVCE